jgi:hypothetical protein
LLEGGGVERIHQSVPQCSELLSCECHLQTSALVLCYFYS